MLDLAENFLRLKENVKDAALSCGRDAEEILIVAATKNHTDEELSNLYEAGCVHFGENRLQEALKKMALLPEKIHWHFIGTLQKNKVKQVVTYFDIIHSVDNAELAKKISEESLAIQTITPILLQVNTSGEIAKHGLDEEGWEREIEKVLEMEGIQVEGLMTMAPLTDNEKIIRTCFSRLRKFRNKLESYYDNILALPHLSMGMSHDYRIAIQEGATMIRIGNAIFNKSH